jgi:glycerate 2-kinase
VSATRAVLVAPDKFKETLSAEQAAAAIGRGLLGSGVERVDLLPVADGGEGTLEALVHAARGRFVSVRTRDPLGRPVTAAVGMLANGRTAVVETAQASGLWRLAAPERDAWAASTHGTGELIRAAVSAGAREVVVSAGGSATTDGGRGALEALGARFSASRADLSELGTRLHGVKLSIACDVRNPMCGPDGAAAAFGPQKGADPATVKRLEERLREWAQLARRNTGRDPSLEPMAGAAGGLAGGLWAFAGAKLHSGAALVLDTLGFDSRMRDAHAVFTGEGRLDEQTLQGKAVFEVATRCRQAGVPCYAVVGQDGLDDFGKRLLSIEVAAAEPPQGRASPEDIERAARRLARRIAGRQQAASGRGAGP